MPIYEYECPQCHIELEKVQSMDAASPKCEKCGRATVRRISPPALIRIEWNGVLPRSKGYKEGYSKEYLKDVPPSTDVV